MNDLKTIPKVSAKRRTVMKGAAATAGVAAVYAAPSMQKIAVSVAEAAVGSVQTQSCTRFQCAGQVDVGGTSGFIAGAASQSLSPASLTYPATTATAGPSPQDPYDPTITEHIFCPITCTCNGVPNAALNVVWADPAGGNSNFHFKLDSLVTSTCSITQPNGANPSDSPNVISFTGLGTLSPPSGADITGVSIQGEFADLGEPGQHNKTDTTKLAIWKGSTVYLDISGTSTDPNTGNYQAFEVTC